MAMTEKLNRAAHHSTVGKYGWLLYLAAPNYIKYL
jgi:hypothetical protein